MLTWLIAAFLFLLPFQWALNPVSGIDLPLGRVLAAIILVWWLSERLVERRLFLPSLAVTASLLSLLFLATTSLLWVENDTFAFRKLLFLLNFLPLMFVFFDLGRGGVTRTFWLKALVIGSALSGGFALGIFFSQFLFGLDPTLRFVERFLPFFLGQNFGESVLRHSSLLVNIGGETWLRATGFFPDPHVASFYFGLTGFLALGLLFSQKRNIFLAVAIVLFLADMLAFSRGGYLGLLVGSLFFLWVGWKQGVVSMRKTIWLAVSLMILITFLGQPIGSRFLSSFSLADASSTDRLTLWEEAFRNIAERPLLGTGIGNYIVEVLPTADYRVPYYAHNLYLDIAVELGLIGLALFLFLFGFAYFNILKNVRMNQWYFLHVALLSSLSLYLTHSVFETALYSVHILPLLTFMLALAWYDGDTYESSR